MTCHFYVDLDKVRVGLDRLEIFLPSSVNAMIERRIAGVDQARYKFVFDVERKRKPRTTGPKSQQAHLHGHLSQIADSLGYHMSELKEAMKEDLPDWPRKTVLGKTVYMSESDADTVLESKAIEWCHVRAAEFGIRLIEGDGEDFQS